MAPRLGVERSDHELALFVFDHNRKVLASRGIAAEDFMSGQWWVEERLRHLWGNVDGPCPGGNLKIPPEVMTRAMIAGTFCISNGVSIAEILTPKIFGLAFLCCTLFYVYLGNCFFIW